MKRALITGVAGQDGSYLAELLLAKGYEVHGLIRRSSSPNTGRIDHLLRAAAPDKPGLALHYGDLADASNCRRILETVQPDEVYNLGAQSHVRVSFELPVYTSDVVATGALRLLEAVRQYQQGSGRQVRFYQAGSSEMFGGAAPPQSETTPFQPRSPYAVSKVAAHGFAVNYREAFGLFISNGILFNHESPRRAETFVTRKVTRAVGRICCGLQKKLFLGNLDAKRDWGFAGDYVEAMWLMLQHDRPDDFVVATGEAYSVRDLLEAAFGYVGLDWQSYVEIDRRLMRPTEVDYLQGDSAKARSELGWTSKTGFRDLVTLMVDSDMAFAKQEASLAELGHFGAPVDELAL
ncbi:MAG: GDP-mannose 4,6-dehydratase [Alphaproteobacteria bacterium]|nr:GDP-mannose 4,6-dehydratase [Alphaproteobacteria bacterium]